MTNLNVFGATRTRMFRTARMTLAAIGLAGLGITATVAPSQAADGIGFDQTAALRVVNNFRAENGLGPLTISARLMQVAEQHSDSMANSDQTNHTVGGSLASRVRGGGVKYSAIAENVSSGQRSYAAAMDAWVRSPGHRQNLLRSNLTTIGFAGSREGGRNYFTQVFAAPPRGFLSAL